MTETDKSKRIISGLMAAAIAVMIASGSQTGYGQLYDYFDMDEYYDNGYALLLEQSPVDAGKITPQVGIYRAELDEVVTLRAIPKPGYRFVYWLGDVTDATTNETTIFVDAPKIVIAVFERSEFELLLEAGIVSGRGRGGLRWQPDFKPRGGGGGGGGGGQPPREPPEPPEWPEYEHEFPVPGDPFPVPEPDEEIPEPATIILLGVGASSLMLGQRKRKSTPQHITKLLKKQ
jgi:hypothetical protein